MTAQTFEIRPFLGEPAPVDLVGDVLAALVDGAAAIFTCRLQRLRPQLYDSYGTRYENVYLPKEDAGLATIRLDFCTPAIVRVRFAPGPTVPDNTLNDHPGNTPMVVGRFEAAVAVEAQESEEAVILTTAAVVVVVDKHPWRLRLYERGRMAEGEAIFATRSRDMGVELPQLNFEFDPSWNFYHRYAYPLGLARTNAEHPQVFESFELAPDEHIYGFGEGYLKLDKHGQKLDLWVEEVYSNTSAAAYKRVPFFASTRGYGLFLNTSFPTTAHMGDRTDIAASLLVHGCQALDYYLIYGPSLKHILARYTDITGKPGLPPKWSFGHWMSRLTYRSQAEVEQVAAELRQHRIPTDVIHIDTGWFGEEGNCDLAFCPDRFPDPAGMMQRLREQGFRVSLWQWPNPMVDNRLYAEAKEHGYLVRRSDGQPYHQQGYATDAGCLDYSNPAMAAWIGEKFQALFRLGVAAIKVDFGEGAPVDGRYHGFPGPAMHNLYPLLYNRVIFEATEAFFGPGQAVIWARSTWAGSQRYPVHWSGDGVAMWADLPSTLRAGLSLGLSGFPFWSHDIGGFVGIPSPDLYARWVQLGMFSSHARAHGAPPREPWRFGPRTEAIYRQYAELRYRLLPYIYSQAVAAAAASLPMLRALVIEYQDDPTVATIEDQYLFGDSVLVAPILTPTNRRRVYLPAGTWLDFWTKEAMNGGRWLEVEAPLEVLPLWVRAGAILPLGPIQQYVGEKPLHPLTIELYAPGGEGRFTIFDEAQPGHEGDDRPAIPIAYHRQGPELRVEIGQTAGEVELVWYGLAAASAAVDGVAATIEPCGPGQRLRFDGRRKGRTVLIRSQG